MASGRLNTVVRHLHQLRSAAHISELSNAQLLERFRAQREEAAFTALTRRHGPMVLAVCRRVLGNLHDAEDAFQATFLILARKAESIRNPNTLGGWLHEVARRTAERARTCALTRSAYEKEATEVPQTDFLAAVAWRDLQPILDAEVAGLPEKYRLPFVLCYTVGRVTLPTLIPGARLRLLGLLPGGGAGWLKSMWIARWATAHPYPPAEKHSRQKGLLRTGQSTPYQPTAKSGNDTVLPAATMNSVACLPTVMRYVAPGIRAGKVRRP